jgi:hypothetical protein
LVHKYRTRLVADVVTGKLDVREEVLIHFAARVDRFMPPYPDGQKIWHITHWRNLPSIVQAGVLWSDAKRLELGLDCSVVGLSEIKRRRLQEIEVSCHSGAKVGEYVPFYFCPRSVMLYILHMGNLPDLNYHEGQEPIIHLQADLGQVLLWAAQGKFRWAFSDRNAGSYLADFESDEDKMAELDWNAIENRDFRNPLVKEAKQAEFLCFEAFPWNLFEMIGVYNDKVAQQVAETLPGGDNQPKVGVRRDWYY